MDDCHGATTAMAINILLENQLHSGIGDDILADANSDGFVADAPATLTVKSVHAKM